MSFLHPGLLVAGLSAMALPILIHLLTRRRRRTIRWGAMRFLLEAYRRQRRKLRLEQLVLLAARCVLIGLIGLALARPVADRDGDFSSGARTVILAIENGLGSSAVVDGQSDLERSKDAALSVVAALDATRGDRVGLVTLGGPVAEVVMPPSGDLASVRRRIEALDTTDSGVDIAGLGAVMSGLDPGADDERVSLVLLGQWRGQRSRSAEIPVWVDGRTQVFVSSPVSLETTNIGVSDLESPRTVLLRQGMGPADLARPAKVTLVRSGAGVSRAETTRVTLLYGSGADEQGWSVVGTVDHRWTEGQSEATVSIPVRPDALETGGAYGVLQAEIDRDSVAGDNVARAGVEIRDRLRVGVVAQSRFGRAVGVDQFGPSDWVRLALAPSAEMSGGLELVDLDPENLDRPRVRSLDVAVVLRPDLVGASGWSELRGLAEDGGLVVVTPSVREEASDWADRFLDEFGVGWTIGRERKDLETSPNLDTTASIGDSILSVLGGELRYLVESVHVSRLYSISGAGESGTLLETSTGQPFMVTARLGAGGVVLFASALDVSWSDLPVKPLMVPLLQELIRQGAAEGSVVLEMAAGGVIASEEDGAELVSVLGDETIRLGRGGTALRRGGVWRHVAGDGLWKGLVVVNADAQAGDVSVRSREGVAAWLTRMGLGRDFAMLEASSVPASLTAGEGDEASGTGGKAWLIVLGALGLAVLEMFASRIFSHARVPAGR